MFCLLFFGQRNLFASLRIVSSRRTTIVIYSDIHAVTWACQGETLFLPGSRVVVNIQFDQVVEFLSQFWRYSSRSNWCPGF
jgi:hypothetical protein